MVRRTKPNKEQVIRAKKPTVDDDSMARQLDFQESIEEAWHGSKCSKVKENIILVFDDTLALVVNPLIGMKEPETIPQLPFDFGATRVLPASLTKRSRGRLKMVRAKVCVHAWSSHH